MEGAGHPAILKRAPGRDGNASQKHFWAACGTDDFSGQQPKSLSADRADRRRAAPGVRRRGSESSLVRRGFYFCQGSRSRLEDGHPDAVALAATIALDLAFEFDAEVGGVEAFEFAGNAEAFHGDAASSVFFTGGRGGFYFAGFGVVGTATDAGLDGDGLHGFS